MTVLATAHASANVSRALWKSILLRFTTSTYRNSTHVPESANNSKHLTRSLQPAGGALLALGPAQRTARVEKNRYHPSLPFQRFSFLSRYFNDFFFHPKPSPRWRLGGLRIIYTCNSQIATRIFNLLCREGVRRYLAT